MFRKVWHLMLVIALLAAVALAVPGCDSSQQEEDTTTQTESAQEEIQSSVDSSQHEGDEITST